MPLLCLDCKRMVLTHGLQLSSEAVISPSYSVQQLLWLLLRAPVRPQVFRLVHDGLINLDAVSVAVTMASDDDVGSLSQPAAGPALHVVAGAAICPIFYHARNRDVRRNWNRSGDLGGAFSDFSLSVSVLAVHAQDLEPASDLECDGRCVSDPVQLLCRFTRLLPHSWRFLRLETPCHEMPLRLCAMVKGHPGDMARPLPSQPIEFCSMPQLADALRRISSAEDVDVSCSDDERSVTLTRCTEASEQRRATLEHGPYVCRWKGAGSGFATQMV